MARPTKNNAEYFSHDADMRDDIKIKALRRKYGYGGYGVWCMLLEILTDSENFEFVLDYELLAGDIMIEPEILREIVTYLISLGLLQFDANSNAIASKTLKMRLTQVIEKRERMQANALKRWGNECKSNAIASKNDAETMQLHSNCIVSAEKTMQSKVKESKVKESKVNNTETTDTIIFSENDDANASKNASDTKSEFPILATESKSDATKPPEKAQIPQEESVPFDEFWVLYPKKVDKKKASALWKTLSKTKQKSAFSAIGEHARLWECEDRDQSIIPHPTTWLRNERWNDVLVFPEKKPSSETEFAEKRHQRALEEKNRENQKRLEEEKFTRTLYDFFSKFSEQKREEIKKLAHENTVKLLGSTDKIGFEQMYRGRLRNHIAELYHAQHASVSA